MLDFAEKRLNPLNEAIRKLDMNILAAQLIFVKTLTEGFDPTARDTDKGVQIICEMCQTGSEEFTRLQMDDEAELLIHVKDTLIQVHEKTATSGNPEDFGFNHGMNLLYKVEAATIIIASLIERVEDELSRNDFRYCKNTA